MPAPSPPSSHFCAPALRKSTFATALPRHERNKSGAGKQEIRSAGKLRRSVARSAAIRSRFSRPFALLDQFPEFARAAELIVLRHWQFAAEKEISKRIFMQDAMHRHSLRTRLEINPVIFCAITVEFFSFPLDHAKLARVKMVEVLRQDLKL